MFQGLLVFFIRQYINVIEVASSVFRHVENKKVINILVVFPHERS